jgi:hypothetical protein
VGAQAQCLAVEHGRRRTLGVYYRAPSAGVCGPLDVDMRGRGRGGSNSRRVQCLGARGLLWSGNGRNAGGGRKGTGGGERLSAGTMVYMGTLAGVGKRAPCRNGGVLLFEEQKLRGLSGSRQ